MDERARIARERAYAKALIATAEMLERDAQAIRRTAEVRQNVADRLEAMRAVPEALAQVRSFVDMGYSESHARDVVADQFGIRADALAHWQAQQERADRRLRHWRRDREIVRLAWAGKTNAEIAELHGLRPTTVSRIIAGVLRGKQRIEKFQLSRPSEVLAAAERDQLSYRGE